MIHESKLKPKSHESTPLTDFKDLKMADLASGAPGVGTRVV
jgi:hypothetical protein